MLDVGKFVATEQTFEDAVDDILVLEKSWAKAAGTYIPVMKSVDFGQQQKYLLVLRVGLESKMICNRARWCDP